MLADVCMSIATMNSAQPRVLEGFPDLAHDDEVDACSGALEMLNPQMRQIVRANSGAAAVQLDLFFAANHSIDPGWGTL